MTGCGPDRSSFLVLQRAADWERGFAFHLRALDAGLNLEPVLKHTLAPANPQGSFLGYVDLARGRSQEVYVLDAATGSLFLFDGDADRFERLAPAGAFQEPTAVTWFPGRLFVAGPTGPQRIVALEDATWSRRWAVTRNEDGRGKPLSLLPPGVPFIPADIAGDRARQRLYALIPLTVVEVVGRPESQSVPAGGKLAIAVFGPGGRLLDLLAPDGLTLAETALTSSLHLRLNLAVAPDGSLFVLDTPARQVFHVTREGALVGSFPVNQRPKGQDQETFRIQPTSLAFDDDATLYLGDRRQELPAGQEDDRFIHRFGLDGRYLGPLAGYRGPVSALAVGPGQRVYLFDPGTRRAGQEPAPSARLLRVLVPRESLDGARGVFYSPPLDSREAGTLWHKLCLPGARFPGHTQIQVSCRTIEKEDDRKAYETLLRQDLAAPDKKTKLDKLGWSQPLLNARDALIEEPPGRYLRMRVKLIGAGQDAPQVPSLEAWFPRTSFLRHLPAVYQETRSGQNFLERFLALFETFFGGVERQIDRLPSLFDPDATPAGFLRWLASWLSLAMDETWPEERQRALLRRVPDLYRRRGTRTGLADLIEVLTGSRPLIVEPFQLAGAENDDLATLLARLYCLNPYCFCVLLRPYQVRNEEELRAIAHLVDGETPAHTRAGVRLLEPLVQLDRHTYLEINSYLNRPAPRLDTGAVLGRDTLLDGAMPGGVTASQEELESTEGEP
jgi:phage tail-like protein